jgi:hypothetical protein
LNESAYLAVRKLSEKPSGFLYDENTRYGLGNSVYWSFLAVAAWYVGGDS